MIGIREDNPILSLKLPGDCFTVYFGSQSGINIVVSGRYRVGDDFPDELLCVSLSNQTVFDYESDIFYPPKGEK